MAGEMTPMKLNAGEEEDEEELFDSGDRHYRGSLGEGSHGIQVVEISNKNCLIGCLGLVVVLLVGMLIGETIKPQGVAVPVAPPAFVHNNGGISPTPDEQHPNPVPSKQPSPTPKPTNTNAFFTQEKATATKAAATKLKDMLENYYAPHQKMLFEGWTTDPSSDQYKEGREYMAKQIARALVSDTQKEFKVGTIGSSVAAGHDNCNYDSYEKQFERTFQEVWEAAGMKYVHLNAGEGGGCGDTHRNQVYCALQLLGPDIDIVHYSWSYFEGRELGALQHEQLIRWMLMMPKQPPVNLYNAGFAAPKKCLDDSNAKQLNNAYAKYGFNAICLEVGLYAGGKYGGKQWGHVGDGYHTTTRYGENEPDQARKDSLGVVFRNWHPGPLGHQFAADNFAYHYSLYMIQAIEMIENIWSTGGDPRVQFSSARIPLLPSDLPEPILCDPQHCSVEEPPGCLSFEEPAYGWHGASLVPEDDELSPFKGQPQNWKKWRDEQGSVRLIPRYELKKYSVPDSKIDCNHLDHCGGIESQSLDDGLLVIKLPKMEVGMVVVCGCCGKHIGKTMFLENEELEITYDGEKIDRSDFDIFPEQKCARIMKKFPQSMNDSKGHVYLTFKITVPEAKTKVRISQIITQ